MAEEQIEKKEEGVEPEKEIPEMGETKKDEQKEKTDFSGIFGYAPLIHKHKGSDTPKISFSDLEGVSVFGWVLVDSGSFTSNTTISDLDGDGDGIYKLIISAYNSSTFQIKLRFNSDSGTNYYNMRHYVSKQGSSIYHNYENITGDDGCIISFVYQKNYIAECLIQPKSGNQRLVLSTCGGTDNSTDYRDLLQTLSIWTNTSSNITSLQIITGSVSGGIYYLFKLSV